MDQDLAADASKPGFCTRRGPGRHPRNAAKAQVLRIPWVTRMRHSKEELQEAALGFEELADRMGPASAGVLRIEVQKVAETVR